MSLVPFTWRYGAKPSMLQGLHRVKASCSWQGLLPSTLCLAPTFPQPPTDPSPTLPSSSDQPDTTPSPTTAKGKEKTKELPPPTEVLDVETEEEVAEAMQLKWNKNDKEQEKKGAKEKELAV